MKNNIKNILRWLDGIPHDIICGLHSGFRICDILFFIFLEFPLLHDTFFNWYHKKILDEGYEYVRCPVCLLLHVKPIKVKRCKCRYTNRISVWFFFLLRILGMRKLKINGEYEVFLKDKDTPWHSSPPKLFSYEIIVERIEGENIFYYSLLDQCLFEGKITIAWFNKFRIT